MTAPTQTPAETRHAWDAIAAGFDRLATPHTMAFGEKALTRLDLHPGVRVLDVACGSGALSIPAARTGADVLAVDISPAMIERLGVRAREEGLPTLRGQVEDCQQLPFDDGQFDVAVSMNGVSLFPDIARGLQEMVRVTRQGGQLLVITFGPLQAAEFIAFSLGALQAAVPGAVPPPGGPPMPPFRLADPTTLRRALQDAGLRDVRVETATWTMPFDSADHLLDTVLTSNPIAGQLTAGLTDEQFGRVRQVLDGMLRERSGGDPGAVLSCQLHIGTGTV